MLTLVEIMIVFSFFTGLAVPEHREFLFSIPAAILTIVVLYKWAKKDKFAQMENMMSSRAINLNGENIPQEVKDKLDAAVKSLLDNDIIKQPEKCKDPHCKNCWGLGDNEHKI